MKTICPFCGCDPFHYEHNGLGYEAVAVNCCDLGCALHGNDDGEVIITTAELRDIAHKIKMAQATVAYAKEYLDAGRPKRAHVLLRRAVKTEPSQPSSRY